MVVWRRELDTKDAVEAVREVILGGMENFSTESVEILGETGLMQVADLVLNPKE